MPKTASGERVVQGLNERTAQVARAALVAAVYTAVTYLLIPISFGPIQLRLSEALTVLPIIYPESIVGLYVGVLVSNILGGLGPWDIFGGSLVTLMAAYATYVFRHSFLAYVPPILFNAFLVSLYVAPIFNVPYWPTVASIGTSQTLVVLGLGYPLIRFLRPSGAAR